MIWFILKQIKWKQLLELIGWENFDLDHMDLQLQHLFRIFMLY
jgi:hypothetical protein